MSDAFYRAFEDKHRGSRDLIKSRLNTYVPFIQPLTWLYQPAVALDLGCGRGEWLELAGEIGFDARGVDLDEGMLDACREHGLNARLQDALQALRELPDSSTAMVTAFHVVEHMPFDVARAMITEALRVLRPGGLLILETPNPENLMVGTALFYQDPSHERPIPQELLRFAVEFAGYSRTKILGLQEPASLHSCSSLKLHDVLDGVSPDYAVLAQKAGPDEVLSRFDQAFSGQYGISLRTLAERYDAVAEQRMAHAKTLISQSEKRVVHTITHLSNRLTSVEHQLNDPAGQMAAFQTMALQAQEKATETYTRLQETATIAREAARAAIEAQQNAADARAKAIEAEREAGEAARRASEAEARAAQSNANLHAILLSRSWRITAPMRAVGTMTLRIRSAIREGRIMSGTKRRIKSLRRTAHAVMRRPKVKRAAMALLNRVPAYKYRLRDMIAVPHSMVPEPQQPHQSGATPMSPRTARIYAELKKALEARKT